MSGKYFRQPPTFNGRYDNKTSDKAKSLTAGDNATTK